MKYEIKPVDSHLDENPITLQLLVSFYYLLATGPGAKSGIFRLSCLYKKFLTMFFSKVQRQTKSKEHLPAIR